LRLRALSPLLATIILIAIVLSAGLVVYAMLSGWMGTYSSMLRIQPTSVDLVVAGNKALLSVSVKNTGNKPLAGIVVTGYDDNGKPFKLAVPPAGPGQASGNTLVIPLGVSNIVLDASGNNNHGTIYGATWVDGKFGKALSFDGVDDYVSISGSATWHQSIPLTISFWVNPARFQSYDRPVTSGSNPSRAWSFYFRTGYTNIVFEFYDQNGNQRSLSGGTFSIANWHHVVAVLTNSSQKLYVNGILVSSANLSITGFNPNASPYFGIGGWGDGSGDRIAGLIDEVRIYNRASDGGEVSFSNANPGLPPTRGLVAWYPMDEGTNAPFSFTAGSSYALTITAYSLDGSVATQTLTIRATG